MSLFHFSGVRHDCVTCARPSAEAIPAIGVFSTPVTTELVSVCHSPIVTGGTSESCAGAACPATVIGAASAARESNKEIERVCGIGVFMGGFPSCGYGHARR